MARYTISNYFPKATINGIQEPDLLNNYFAQAFKIKRAVNFYTLRYHDIFRPDLLSNKLYGTPDLWWILFKYNNIDDVWNDLEEGMVIHVPSMADIEDFVSDAQKLKSAA